MLSSFIETSAQHPFSIQNLPYGIFTTKTNTDAGAISTRIELDFVLSGADDVDERISNSWDSRLRHAFVKWDYNDH